MSKAQMNQSALQTPMEDSLFNRISLSNRMTNGGAQSNAERIQQLNAPSDVSANPLLQHLPLKRGDTGEGVKLLQQSLNRQGMDLVEDGIFGPATERAVKVLQGSRNLDVNGVMTAECIMVSPSTAPVIDSTANHAVNNPEAQGGISPQHHNAQDASTGSIGNAWIDEGERLLRRKQQETPNELTAHLPLSIGSRGDAVRTLQTQLNNHNANMGVDGDYGRQTENMVRAFQAANQLVITGAPG